VVITILTFFAILLTAILFRSDKVRRLAHSQGYWWSDAIIKLNPFWKVEVFGLENIDYSKTYVIVANHQSMADIVLLYQTRMQFKWVAKEDLFSVPFLGWSMSLNRYIRIARGQLGSIKHVYREASAWLERGMSVLFFPEGTRSETSEMRDFQNGAFKLAIRRKVSVLPVRLEGTRDVLSKGSWLFTTQAASSMKVLPPIDTIGLGAADFVRLRDMTRARLESA
jgi:1-acyl-sn-glycerol-3-phosphate acyltransferase